MGTPMVWDGSPLCRNGSPAIGAACCCGGPCECIAECPEDAYEITIDVPPEHAGWIQANNPATCQGTPASWNGGFLRISNIGPPQTVYELQWNMSCEIVDDVATWTLVQQYIADTTILLSGTFYSSYTATKRFQGDCIGGVPPEMVVDEWDDIEWAEPGLPVPEGFPLGIHIGNPLP
jgi:hypothetical protein